MALGVEVGLGPGQLPSPKKRTELPQLSAYLYCGQTLGCIKMPLGMEVGLSPGDFVFDEDSAPSPKGGRVPPIFGPYLLWPNGCMDQDALGAEVRLGPDDIVLDENPLLPPPKGGGAPHFRPMSIVARPLDGSRWHLAWRWALVQASSPAQKRGQSSPNCRPISIVAKRLDASRCHLIRR